MGSSDLERGGSRLIIDPWPFSDAIVDVTPEDILVLAKLSCTLSSQTWSIMDDCMAANPGSKMILLEQDEKGTHQTVHQVLNSFLKLGDLTVLVIKRRAFSRSGRHLVTLNFWLRVS